MFMGSNLDYKQLSEQRIEAAWCVDSETGKRVLADLVTGKVLVRES